MNISVNIATWNNCDRLSRTLESFCHCTIPHGVSWELVLVNNNCSDRTDQIISSFVNRLPIVYVHQPIQGLSVARNAGIQAARGELILFTDDDVTPSKEWISAYWEAFVRKSKQYFFGGPILSQYEKQEPDKRILELAPRSVRGYHYGSVDKEFYESVFLGPNWACPMKALNQVGYFDIYKGLDASLGRMRAGEEIDLMERLLKAGYLAWYVAKASLKHFVPEEKCSYMHIAFRQEASLYERVLIEKRRGIGSGIFHLIVSYVKLTRAWITKKNFEPSFICYRMALGNARGLIAVKKEFLRRIFLKRNDNC